MHSLPTLPNHGRRRFLLSSIALVAVVVAANAVFWGKERPAAAPAAVLDANAALLMLTTDKTDYAAGEPVAVTFRNTAAGTIAETATATVSLRTSRTMGRNYGLGLIEQESASGYVAVEPVWRCDGPCGRPCTAERRLPPHGLTTVSWDQRIRSCQGDELTGSPAPAGRYRVTTAAWDERAGTFRLLSSLPFTIH